MRPPARPSKVRIIVLDDGMAAQLEAGLDAASDIEVVWSGTSTEALVDAAPKAQVLLANIDYLGADPAGRMNELVEATGAELGIAMYAFAKRDLLERLASERVRTLRSPLNLPTLRCQMMSIIARNLLAANALSGSVAPPRYSAVQLGKLQQISTAIDCECPNHLATLLQNLYEFETYSANCESRNTADAEIHRLLHETTARARTLLERAMDKLISHEKISV